MKKKGMTLIESIATIAILGVVFLLATPLVRSFGRVSNRTKTQKEIDAEFSVVNEFIQKNIRAAKGSSGSEQYAEVLGADGNSTSRDGIELRLEIPTTASSTPDSIAFIFDPNENELIFEKNGTEDPLMENIADAKFGFQEGIVLYYIDYGADMDAEEKSKFRTSLKGSASTRIDIQ